jgi:hypothetical protein
MRRTAVIRPIAAHAGVRRLLRASRATAELADQPHCDQRDHAEQDHVGQDAGGRAAQAEVRQQVADAEAGCQTTQHPAPVTLGRRRGGCATCRTCRGRRCLRRLLGRRRVLLRRRLLALLRHARRLLADTARSAQTLGIGVERCPESQCRDERHSQEFSAKR